jgi:adenylate cyclase
MAPKKKLLCGLVVSAFVPVTAAAILLRPDTTTLIILGAVSLTIVILAMKFVLPAGIERQSSGSHAQPGDINIPHPPHFEPESLLHRIIPEVSGLLLERGLGQSQLSNLHLWYQLRKKLMPILTGNAATSPTVEEKEATVLLSDLRGFTTITENYSALQVADMLNRYFTIMCEIIYRHGGTVDKFIGDSIMALFGVPHSTGNDVENAVCCAVEMQLAMDAFNAENKKRDIPDQYMGIGINTGRVLAGWVGSELHSEYTAIGDDINLTSRIEAFTLRGQILIGSNTYEKVKQLIEVKEPMHISVKGKRDPLIIYELCAIGPPYNLTMPGREVRKNLRIDVNLPFKFQICVGKIVSAEFYDGRILNMSTGGMLACTLAEIEPHTNIKFHLDPKITGVEGEDIYGKIIRVNKKQELYEANIEFTAIDSKDCKTIKELINRTIEASIP